MSPAVGHTRLVLERGVTRTHVLSKALATRWELAHEVTPAGYRPYELVWRLHGGAFSVHYIEDRLIEVDYLLVRGHDRAQVVHTVSALMPVVPIHRLVEEALDAQSPPERVDAIRRLAASAKEEADERILYVFARYFEDPDEGVRAAAIFAATYPAWHRFEGPLRRLGDHDPSERVRDLAQRALQSLGLHGWTAGSHHREVRESGAREEEAF